MPSSTKGRYVAETFFHTRGTGEVLLHFSGGEEINLDVDGVTVFRRSPTDVYRPQSRWVWLATEPGLHRVRLEASVTGGSPTFALHLTPGAAVSIDCFSADCMGTSDTPPKRPAHRPRGPPQPERLQPATHSGVS